MGDNWIKIKQKLETTQRNPLEEADTWISIGGQEQLPREIGKRSGVYEE